MRRGQLNLPGKLGAGRSRAKGDKRLLWGVIRVKSHSTGGNAVGEGGFQNHVREEVQGARPRQINSNVIRFQTKNTLIHGSEESLCFQRGIDEGWLELHQSGGNRAGVS